MIDGATQQANVFLNGDALVGARTFRATDPTARLAALRGQFALHHCDGSHHVLARDPIGVNKLFFAISADGEVDASNYFIDLRRRGHAAAQIWSVPPGHAVRISTSNRTLSLEKLVPSGNSAAPASFDMTAHAARIRARLERTFRALAPLVKGRPLYVTMSGGLDSSGIACLARDVFGDFVGVTFRVVDAETPAPVRDDLHYARMVADALGVPLEVIEVSTDALLAMLDEVLLYGQDYRDFNVHCGLVNTAIAHTLRERFGAAWSRRPIVLTGDSMNELMADYAPVTYRGREYYALPRLPLGTLRRFLVNGLGTGDREVGLFARCGLDVLQPYALCADVYSDLPDAFLSTPHAKQRLARAVFGDRLPDAIYERPKVRAQVGSADAPGGTLAALIDRGVGGAALEQRCAALFGMAAAELKCWIRAGNYRFTTAYPMKG